MRNRVNRHKAQLITYNPQPNIPLTIKAPTFIIKRMKAIPAGCQNRLTNSAGNRCSLFPFKTD